MSDNSQIHDPNISSVTTLIKVVVLIACVYPLVHYTIINDKDPSKGPPVDEKTHNETNVTVAATPIIKKLPPPQPSCPLSHLQVILQDLCKNLILQRTHCTPEDINNLEKHKLPPSGAKSSSKGEPRGTIVGCVAAGLLLTSLGAAFLELYKAKSQTPVKAKAPMSRKCSLADLTVLKHNRKELVRRESIMEIPEVGAGRMLGRKVSRPPLRLD